MVFANQRLTLSTSKFIQLVTRDKRAASVPSLSPPGNVRGTRERDLSLLRLDGPRRCSVTKGPQELILYRLDAPHDIVRSICSTISEIHASRV